MNWQSFTELYGGLQSQVLQYVCLENLQAFCDLLPKHFAEKTILIHCGLDSADNSVHSQGTIRLQSGPACVDDCHLVKTDEVHCLLNLALNFSCLG